MKTIATGAAIVALIATACLVLPPRAQASSPFCGATLWMAPWDASSDRPSALADSADYALSLEADAKDDVTARVTLVTDTDAFTANVPRVAVKRMERGTDRTALLHVRFERAQRVRYAFVDAVGTDGAQLSDCPSDVAAVSPYRQADAAAMHLGDALTVGAKLVQTLPALTCASAYIAPRATRGDGVAVGHFGDVERHTKVHVYIDSDGHVLKTSVYTSSGVEGLDMAALAAAQQMSFAPARFLCTPVVSDFLIDVEYKSE